MDSVTVNLHGTDRSAAYVGISRAKDVNKLYIEGIDILRTFDKPDSNITEFYKSEKASLWFEDFDFDDLFIPAENFTCKYCKGSSKTCQDLQNP